MNKYIINADIIPKELAELRKSVGWNTMEKQLSNTLLKDYFNIACYNDHGLIGYVSVVSNYVTDSYIQDLIIHYIKIKALVKI